MKIFNESLAGLSMCLVTFLPQLATAEAVNIARTAQVRASSVLESPRYVAANAVDGVISDESRWVSARNFDGPVWLELTFPEPIRLGGVHLFSGFRTGDAISGFNFQYRVGEAWHRIPSAQIEGNHATALRVPFDDTVEIVTTGLRLNVTDSKQGIARVKELKVWPYRSEGIPALAAPRLKGEPRIPQIYLNQSGFNRGKPKRFTAPRVEGEHLFTISQRDESAVLYRGIVQNHIGDFSDFEPAGAAEYVLHVGDEVSVPFRIGHWWLERVTYQGMIDFMIDSRHYVGNSKKPAKGSFGWRDDHQFAFELNSLVSMLLSNPEAYFRMSSQIEYVDPQQHAGKWGALEPYTEAAPDLVKLIHWGADIIVTQELNHMLIKEQLAYFLYAWPVLQQWLPQQNYDVVKAYVLANWTKSELSRKYPYDEVPNDHNVLRLQESVGSTKGANPPGHTVLPNLLMYAVAVRDAEPNSEQYFEAAYAQVEWMIQQLDWENPIITKGQRMSEHVTMTGLAAMLRLHPDRSPAGLRAKVNEWAQVMIERSENMWDFRKLSKDQWVPTGNKPTMWNEPGNVMGFPASALAAMPYIDSEVTRERLNQLVWSHFDNCFGRNPTGRHFSYDAPREIEGVEFGWYSFYDGGIGQLAQARFVFDGAPKNAHYPYQPEVGNIGWTEGWVNFNTAYNLSMSYLATAETQIEGQYQSGALKVRLKAPINFDYTKQEHAKVRLLFADGSERQMLLEEESVDSAYLSGRLELETAPLAVAYGYGYFEVKADL
ncbi:hypothetical protein QEH52_02260 [Coraliomargarita sp. SDUM461003]|uniref:DUF7402 domain-containing protein n=1 Tax=Thalassobacterium maritimum TaxID=3041265 RepID=A0ABU1AQ75_9BACT|nr:discoidin domain-containing protein [Coraliomargarita sp. SDUM461003]MDQ8206314.1 hypothetical protein [Coraliomargarita sp. SDUM461003]